MVEKSRLTVVNNGAFQHAWGDTYPVEQRYQELIDTEQLPETFYLKIKQFTILESRLTHPRAVIVWNVSGQHLRVQPTATEADALSKQILQVGLRSEWSDAKPDGWQILYPCRAGDQLYPSTLLWLGPETRVCLQPQYASNPLQVKVMAIPGND